MENESCYVCDYAKHEINRGLKEVRCGLNNRFVAYPKLGCSNCRKTCTTNADRIRQMMDDEELLNAIGTSCFRCVYSDYDCSVGQGLGCTVGNMKWLKQEVSEDAAERTR